MLQEVVKEMIGDPVKIEGHEKIGAKEAEVTEELPEATVGAREVGAVAIATTTRATVGCLMMMPTIHKRNQI